MSDYTPCCDTMRSALDGKAPMHLSSYSRACSDDVTTRPALSRNFGGRSWSSRFCPWCGCDLRAVRGVADV